MTTWFDGLDVEVEIAFATAPLATTPTWTDVSTYVRELGIRRGRTSEFTDFSPGLLTITLDNADRRFDPEYASSPYVGNLLPMKKIRVTLTSGAVAAAVFTGYVMGWPQSYRQWDSTVTITAVDASRFLEQSLLPSSAYAYEVLEDSPAAYWPLQSAEGGTTVDVVAGRTLSSGGIKPATDVQFFQAPTFTDIGVPLGESDALTSSVPSTGYNQVSLVNDFDSDSIAAPKAIEFYVRNTGDGALGGAQVLGVIARKNTTNYMFATFSYDTGQLGVGYGNLTDAKYKSLTQVEPVLTQDGLHHIAVRADTSNLYVVLNGVQIYSTSLTAGTPPSLTGNDLAGVTITVQAGETSTNTPAISHFAWYSTAPTTARFLAHHQAGLVAYGYPTGERGGARIGRILDAIDWPAAERDLSTGKTRLGPYLPASRNALDAMREVAESERDLLFVAKDGKVTLRDRNYQLATLPLASGAGENLTTEDGEELLTEDGENLTTEGGGFLTFSDDGSELDYEDVVIDANSVDPLRTVVQVSYDGGEVRVSDSTAISNYGRALEDINATLVDRRRTAEKLAAFVLRTSKDPQTRITELTIDARRDASSLMPALIDLELGDKVVVERTPQNVGAAISKRVTVEGIEHEMSGDTWRCRLYLSPALDVYDTAPYLLAGDVTYGKVGATAGNLIPA